MNFTKPTAFALLVAALLLGAGCEDITEPLQEEIESSALPEVRVFAADQKTTYEAARAALAQIGFRFVKGGPAKAGSRPSADLRRGAPKAAPSSFPSG